MRPLQVNIRLVIASDLLKVGILAGFKVLLAPVAEKLLLLRQAKHHRIPLRRGALLFLLHKEQCDQQLLIILIYIREELRTFFDDLGIEMGLLLLKRLRRD